MKSRITIMNDEFHISSETFRLFYHHIWKNERALPVAGMYDYFWDIAFSYEKLKVVVKIINEGDEFKRIVLRSKKEEAYEK